MYKTPEMMLKKALISSSLLLCSENEDDSFIKKLLIMTLDSILFTIIFGFIWRGKVAAGSTLEGTLARTVNINILANRLHLGEYM